MAPALVTSGQLRSLWNGGRWTSAVIPTRRGPVGFVDLERVMFALDLEVGERASERTWKRIAAAFTSGLAVAPAGDWDSETPAAVVLRSQQVRALSELSALGVVRRRAAARLEDLDGQLRLAVLEALSTRASAVQVAKAAGMPRSWVYDVRKGL
jgi:hypothetical protein